MDSSSSLSEIRPNCGRHDMCTSPSNPVSKCPARARRYKRSKRMDHTTYNYDQQNCSQLASSNEDVCKNAAQFWNVEPRQIPPNVKCYTRQGSSENLSVRTGFKTGVARRDTPCMPPMENRKRRKCPSSRSSKPASDTDTISSVNSSFSNSTNSNMDKKSFRHQIVSGMNDLIKQSIEMKTEISEIKEIMWTEMNNRREDTSQSKLLRDFTEMTKEIMEKSNQDIWREIKEIKAAVTLINVNRNVKPGSHDELIIQKLDDENFTENQDDRDADEFDHLSSSTVPNVSRARGNLLAPGSKTGSATPAFRKGTNGLSPQSQAPRVALQDCKDTFSTKSKWFKNLPPDLSALITSQTSEGSICDDDPHAGMRQNILPNKNMMMGSRRQKTPVIKSESIYTRYVRPCAHRKVSAVNEGIKIDASNPYPKDNSIKDVRFNTSRLDKNKSMPDRVAQSKSESFMRRTTRPPSPYRQITSAWNNESSAKRKPWR